MEESREKEFSGFGLDLLCSPNLGGMKEMDIYITNPNMSGIKS